MRSRSPRRRENAEKSTSAIGIAITVRGRMTVLIANVQAPSAGMPTSFPISRKRRSSSASLAQRPPATRIANEPSRRNAARENSRVGTPGGAPPERGRERGQEDDLLQHQRPRARTRLRLRTPRSTLARPIANQ